MANLILERAAGTGTAITSTVSSSCQYIQVIYKPVDLRVVAGANYKLSELIDATFALDLQFNTSQKGVQNGAIVLATSLPLYFFAHVSPLLGKVETNVILKSNDFDSPTGTVGVETISFTFPIFDGCRAFGATDRLTVKLVGDAGVAGVSIYSIDAPYASPSASAISYLTGTVNGKSDFAFPACDVLYVATDKPFQLSVLGIPSSPAANTSIMQFPMDFQAHFAQEPITAITPYNMTDFIGIETKLLSVQQSKIFALDGDQVLYIAQKLN